MKNTYLGYEDIAVKNFYKISETSDFNWFFKGFKGVDSKTLSEKENETLAQATGAKVSACPSTIS